MENKPWQCACVDSKLKSPETVTCWSCHLHNPYLEKLAREFVPPTAAKPAYTERDIIELACRAPACPEWFRPDMGGKVEPVITEEDRAASYWDSQNLNWFGPVGVKYRESHAFNEELKKQRLIQWPRAYAKMVLEAGT